jgi:quercetin dioxygenase-like cupin family protein
MKPALAIVLSSAIAAVSASAASTPSIVTPQEIAWGAAPPSLPAGAQSAVLYGDPSKAGPFAMRLKFPNGYRVPQHSHPVAEVVTVISGSFHLATGEGATDSNAKTLPAGSFFALEAGLPHYGFTDAETVIQINSTGPWGITYVNPKDDPRQKMQ